VLASGIVGTSRDIVADISPRLDDDERGTARSAATLKQAADAIAL
jgi:hypothetical protein